MQDRSVTSQDLPYDTSDLLQKSPSGSSHTVSGDARKNTNPNEFKVQMRRYLNGMYLITKNTNDERVRKNLSSQANNAEQIYETNVNKALSKHQAKIQELKKQYQVSLQEKKEEEIKKISKAHNKAIAEADIEFEKLQRKYLQELYTKFAHTIYDSLRVHFPQITIEKAYAQLTMARDIAIWLKKPKPVVTEEKYLTEKTEFLQISQNYYEKHVFGAQYEDWLQGVKKYAGFDPNAQYTWIENFFDNPENRKVLLSEGVSATPSSRWSTLPSNARKHTITLKDEKEAVENEISIIAIGTVDAFDVSEKLQEDIAIAQLEEIFINQLEDQYSKCKKLYGDLAQDFYFNYQTLLSPMWAESNLPHKDNNERFVKMAKLAMSRLQEKYPDVLPFRDKIHFLQTNSAVNKLAPLAEEFSEDKLHREEKLQSTAVLVDQLKAKTAPDHHNALEKFSQYIKTGDYENRQVEEALRELGAQTIQEARTFDKKGILDNAIAAVEEANVTLELKNEIILRMRATYYLKRIYNNDIRYAGISTYQRNIMITSLEALSQGNQALTLAGCKSARDRTAIFLSAIKTMMQNPGAMHHWDTLNDGIMDSLIRGHHFRAMEYHCQVLKVEEVHKDLAEQLPPDVRTKIEERMPFTKTVEEGSWKTKYPMLTIIGAGVALAVMLSPIGPFLAGGYFALQVAYSVAAGVIAFYGSNVAYGQYQHGNIWNSIKQNKWKILGASIGIALVIGLTGGLGAIPIAAAFGLSMIVGYLGYKAGGAVEQLALGSGSDPAPQPIELDQSVDRTDELERQHKIDQTIKAELQQEDTEAKDRFEKGLPPLPADKQLSLIQKGLEVTPTPTPVPPPATTIGQETTVQINSNSVPVVVRSESGPVEPETNPGSKQPSYSSPKST